MLLKKAGVDFAKIYIYL